MRVRTQVERSDLRKCLLRGVEPDAFGGQIGLVVTVQFAALLAVVLEQQTELDPTEIMTDTGAYTDVVFGLFWLLGYQFSPRIAHIGGARYWRIDPVALGSVRRGSSWQPCSRRR